MPPQFPCAAFTVIREKAGKRSINNSHDVNLKEWLSASNLTAWRFRLAYEAWNEIQTIKGKYGNWGDHEVQYRAEKQLYIVATAIISCVEATVYGLSALCSHNLATHADKNKWSDALELAKQLGAAGKFSTLVTALQEINPKQGVWKFWLCIRNRMNHRSNLPRIGYASIGGPAPVLPDFSYAVTSSTPALALSVANVQQRVDWLQTVITDLVIHGLQAA